MRVARKFTAVAAAILCIAFAHLVSARASAEEISCDMYGIHIGADAGDAHAHFMKHQKGWEIHGWGNDGDGWVSIEYRQEFQRDVHGSVTMMILAGQVNGLFTILSTPEMNDAGLLEIATIVSNMVSWESKCKAEISRLEVGGVSSYYAEGAGGTSRLYRFHNEGGVTSVIITQGPTETVHGIMRDAILGE